MRTLSFKSAGGLGNVHARVLDHPAPRGVVQISHGMYEHGGRYVPLMEFLHDQGFACCVGDHAGHGKSTPDHPRGQFGSGVGYQSLVDDLHALRSLVEPDYPGVPYFLFGHSMGSFIARAYAVRYGASLSGLLLMGTTGPLPVAMSTLGQLVARLCPQNKPVPWMNNLLFFSYNKSYPKPRSRMDWLSRDGAQRKGYIEDPLRIDCFTGRGYRTFLSLIHDISAPAWFEAYPKALPTLLISGDDDPVGQYGKGVRKVDQRLTACGVHDVNLMLYPGARHELLFESNREEVLQDMLAWLRLHLPKEAGA